MRNEDLNDFILTYGVRDIQQRFEAEPINSFRGVHSAVRETNVVITMDYNKFLNLVDDANEYQRISNDELKETLLHNQYPDLKEAFAQYRTMLLLMQNAA